MTDMAPDLWNPSVRRDIPSRFDPRPIAGVMAPSVGHQYTVEEIWRFRLARQEILQAEEQQIQPLSARIRAFDIPSLKHAQVIVNRLDGFPAALFDLLCAHLPPWEWDLSHLRLGPLKKYGILHAMFPAPTDTTTQQPMVLELFGHLSSLNGQPVDRDWFAPFRQADRTNEDSPPLGELSLLLEYATYANTRNPGIGVPFYL